METISATSEEGGGHSACIAMTIARMNLHFVYGNAMDVGTFIGPANVNESSNNLMQLKL
jgi:hypothetical protein